MTRIDAHHHVWRLSRADYGWLTPERGPIYRDFGLADLMPHLAAAAIDGTILVQAALTEAETAFMLDVAKGAELVRGVVGWIDLDADDAAARIDAIAGRELLVGLRPMVQDIADDDWLLRPELAAPLEAMAQYGLVFDALVLPRHCRGSFRWSMAIRTCNSCSTISASRNSQPATSRPGRTTSRALPHGPTSS